jgi:hypothetical protein
LLLAWFKQHFLGKQLIRVFLWTLMLPCPTKMHFLTKHIKLYTQTIPFLLLNNVNFILNNFLQFFFLVLTLWKTLVLTNPIYIYGQTNGLNARKSFFCCCCEEWLPITTHENNFLKWIVQKPRVQVLRTHHFVLRQLLNN